MVGSIHLCSSHCCAIGLRGGVRQTAIKEGWSTDVNTMIKSRDGPRVRGCVNTMRRGRIRGFHSSYSKARTNDEWRNGAHLDDDGAVSIVDENLQTVDHSVLETSAPGAVTDTTMEVKRKYPGTRTAKETGIDASSPFALSTIWDAEIVRLAFPALLTTLLDPVMGMIDAAIVGRLGTAQLAAVGACTVMYNFSNFIFNFLLYTTTPRIAAAASCNDADQVSKIASQGLWVAITIGCITATALFVGCPVLFSMIGTSPDVMEHAVPFLRVRCLASPAIMMSYVMSGVFRGFKDTKATLISSTWSNIAHIALDVVCIFWMNMGAIGAAVATTSSLWLNWAILAYNISFTHGYLKISDMKRYPSFSEVAPMLRNGILLSTRSLLAMSTLMFATKMAASLGAAALAAHEIIRQIWVVSNQAFTSLDIATQSLVAFYLGKGDRESASQVFLRTSALTVFAGIIIMSTLLLCRHILPSMFTSDPAVMALVASCIPLIAIYMPMDGMASVLDGFLMGSEQTGALSKVMAATSAVCACALVMQNNIPSFTVTIVTIWAAIKVLTVGRLIGNSYSVFYKSSVYVSPPTAPA